MSITLVAGLGNPGREYEASRHNFGWVVIDALARQLGLRWKPQPTFEADVARWDRAPGQICFLAKPLTFMNESGRALQKLARFYKLAPAEIIAVYDDLTLPLGSIKVSVKGGAGGHNGVASLREHLGDGFARYRLGIGPKEPAEMDLKDFVLGRFTSDQLALIQRTLETYVAGLELLIASGPDQAMNRLNRRETHESNETQLPRDLHS